MVPAGRLLPRRTVPRRLQGLQQGPRRPISTPSSRSPFCGCPTSRARREHLHQAPNRCALWDLLAEAGGPHGFSAAVRIAFQQPAHRKSKYRLWGGPTSPHPRNTTPRRPVLDFAVKIDRTHGADCRRTAAPGTPRRRTVCAALNRVRHPAPSALGQYPVLMSTGACGRMSQRQAKSTTIGRNPLPTAWLPAIRTGRRYRQPSTYRGPRFLQSPVGHGLAGVLDPDMRGSEVVPLKFTTSSCIGLCGR